ncbi:hypothetical protein [Rhodocyclus purpureus]|uniref:hypothetical protein n=1 Tax=Rhodocyclus purpureus TaxID=1067 RepID=UPI0019118421|nr:hypothetical protein [Rhodocyclus purpureus]
MALTDVFYKVLNGINKRLKAMPDGTYAEVFAGYDLQDDMLKVKSVQKKFRDSFIGASLDATKWETPTIGSGGSVAVAGGVLTLGSGIVANAVTSVISLDTYTIPFRVQCGMTLSQRIANTEFYLEAVSVNPDTGVPDGLHSIAWMFDGTSATQGKYLVQNGGLAPLASAASTITTTAGTGFYELEPFADEAWFHSSVLDATGARAQSYRRHQQIPDPNAVYKIRMRWKNGTTAPASNTNAVIQFISIQDYAELTAEITAGRGQAVAGQALGVQVCGGSVTVSGSVTASGTVTASNVAGPVAHDGARGATAPLIAAAHARSSAYPTVANGDVADLVTTLQGVQVVRPWQIPELEWAYAAAAGGVVNTTDVVLAVAAGAGLRLYLTSMSLSNASAVATEVVVKDGATVIWRGHLPANAPMSEIMFSNPLKSTANTALNFACLTAGAAVYVNAQGFIAA